MTAIGEVGVHRRQRDRRKRGEQNKNTFDRACRRRLSVRVAPPKKPGGMALRPIITLPDPKLRLVSKKIERVDDAAPH